MRILFSPAIVLVNRLSYTKKFLLMGLLFLTAIAVLTYSLFVNLNATIHTSQQQLESISLIKPITRTVRNIQLHRGISAVLLGGNEALRDSYVARKKEAVEAFNVLQGGLPAHLKTTEEWRSIKANWESLQNKEPDRALAGNFAAHTHLIEQLLHLARTQTRNRDSDTFYLLGISTDRLPEVLEHLGQIRAYGTGILSQKRITVAQERVLYGQIANFYDALTFLQTDFDKVARRHPALQVTLSAAFINIAESAEKMIRLVELEILAGQFTTAPADFLMISTAAIDSGYSTIYETLLPRAEILIRARLANAENTLYASIGIALLMFLLVGYFLVGSYYATIRSIRSLALGAYSFASGNLGERIHLDTHDELKQVSDSFNRMAASFNTILEERELIAQNLRENELKYRTLADSASALIWSAGTDKLCNYFNLPWLKFTGRTLEQELGNGWVEGVHPEDLTRCVSIYNEAFDKCEAFSMEYRLRYNDGTYRWIQDDGCPRYDSAGNFIGYLGYCFDITERKQAEEEMINLAYYDTLTGLPNRTLFYDRLAQEIKKAHRTSLKMALLYIDLDKFKDVNDTLGHQVGDILLQEAARRIRDCVREADTVARLGGDEFIILISELDGANNIERVAENILQKLAEPFSLGAEVTHVSASMGITLYPDDAAGVEGLFKNADQAMYVAKNAGRNRFSYFTPALEQAAQSRLRLLNDLRGALANDQFRVYFQPIVELATGQIHKAEALIRWQHPGRGMVSPGEFIPLAEESVLIVEIGDWVFREAAQQAKQWRDRYHHEFQISVNVSPVQLCHTGDCVGKKWFDYLHTLELPGQSIVIEITEGLLLDAESEVTNKLLQFRDEGIQVSIDDFGTGYSSLSYLKKFSIDYLKIDQSFVRNLATDPDNMALSEAIIVMAHKLGLKVIAEGVETEEQCKLLADAGCDYAQGYLFSRPVPSEEFEALLERGDMYKLAV